MNQEINEISLLKSDYSLLSFWCGSRMEQEEGAGAENDRSNEFL